jgi:hypothetical protein
VDRLGAEHEEGAVVLDDRGIVAAAGQRRDEAEVGLGGQARCGAQARGEVGQLGQQCRFNSERRTRWSTTSSR